ncbi:MAG: SUMF1/EgtB/PvdO family nonheme iron enzyme [Saprospiraceae bacterium]
MKIWQLILITFTCSFVSYGQQTSGSFSGNNYALLVSVSDYESQIGYGDLPTVEEGVNSLQKELKEMYGFEVETLKNPSREELNGVLATYREKAFGKDDQLYILFSGHGKYVDFEYKGYFVPSKGPAIDLTTIRNIVNYIPCEHILLTIDACFSGTIFQKINYQGQANIRRPGDTDIARKQNQIKRLLRNKSRLVLTSGGKERTRAESGGSPFVRSIVSALREAYTTGNGLVTYNDLEARLEDLNPVPRYGTLQSHEGGSFVFYVENMIDQPTSSKKKTPDDLTPPKRVVKPKVTIPNTPTAAVGQLISILGGKYRMGKPKVSLDADPDGEHLVQVSNFSLGKTEVTFEEYDAFCTATNRDQPDDEGWGRGNRPVINVSWYDAVLYCNWLSTQQGLKKVYNLNGSSVDVDWEATGYRLPTEAEWEFAAKKGAVSSSIAFGDGSTIADPSRLNFDASPGYNVPYAKTGRFRNKTVPCASLNSPNSIGVFDLSGNVSEWCHDIYSYNFYANSPIDNPVGISKGVRRVIRGGSYNDTAEKLSVFARDSAKATQRDRRVGFRIARGN